MGATGEDSLQTLDSGVKLTKRPARQVGIEDASIMKSVDFSLHAAGEIHRPQGRHRDRDVGLMTSLAIVVIANNQCFAVGPYNEVVEIPAVAAYQYGICAAMADFHMKSVTNFQAIKIRNGEATLIILSRPGIFNTARSH